MAWDDYRLETSDGDVIMYLAPEFENEVAYNNDVTTNGLPGEENPPLNLDLGQWTMEVTVQGQFETSTNLPSEHRQALLDLESWTEPITASQQVWRILDFVAHGRASPPYHLYLGEWEFTAATNGSIDPLNGVFSNVAATEIRPSEEAGLSRDEWLLRFSLGTVEGSG